MENVVNKEMLTEIIAEKTGKSKKEVSEFINAYTQSIKELLKEGKSVKIVGFGTFSVKDRAARQGRNPRNPDEVIDIPACKAPAFKPGKDLKEFVN